MSFIRSRLELKGKSQIIFNSFRKYAGTLCQKIWRVFLPKYLFVSIYSELVHGFAVSLLKYFTFIFDIFVANLCVIQFLTGISTVFIQISIHDIAFRNQMFLFD